MTEEKEIGEKSRICVLDMEDRWLAGSPSLSLFLYLSLSPSARPGARLLNMHVSGSGGAQSNRWLFFFPQ